MTSYGDHPFGLNDVKLVSFDTTPVQVDLPDAQTMQVTPRLKSGELHGDDKLVSVVSMLEGADFSLESGGIPLEAYALMLGLTATEAGTAPNLTNTLTMTGAARMPWFKVYGKSLGEGDDDVHVKLRKCKLTKAPEGSLQDGSFFVTSLSGVCVDDGTAVMEIVQNETATTLPAS